MTMKVLATIFLTDSTDLDYENDSKNIQLRITNRMKAVHTKLMKCHRHTQLMYCRVSSITRFQYFSLQTPKLFSCSRRHSNYQRWSRGA